MHQEEQQPWRMHPLEASIFLRGHPQLEGKHLHDAGEAGEAGGEAQQSEATGDAGAIVWPEPQQSGVTVVVVCKILQSLPLIHCHDKLVVVSALHPSSTSDRGDGGRHPAGGGARGFGFRQTLGCSCALTANPFPTKEGFF